MSFEKKNLKYCEYKMLRKFIKIFRSYVNIGVFFEMRFLVKINLNENYCMDKEFLKNNYKLKQNMLCFSISLIVSINKV